MNKELLVQIFNDKNIPIYDRENFDSYINKTKFSFNIPSIHITGSNGKGSIATYIKNLYFANNYKVGIFTSPWLQNVNEMISINDKNISDDDFIKYYNDHCKLFDKFNLTTFEMQTIIAYKYFSDNNVDLVVIEVGMGGFIDATNIITPELSIISNISLEHTYFLGRSLSEIAYNKAGIIKDEKPVLIGNLDETCEYVIREYAKNTKSKVYRIDSFHHETFNNNKITFDYRPYHNLEINTNCYYQISNACFAIEASNILKDIFPVEEKNIKIGLQMPLANGRFEYIKPNILLDCAHNPNGIEMLLESIQKTEKRQFHVVFAAFLDKNIDKMLSTLGLEASSITLTTFEHKRARTEDDYFLYLEDFQFVSDFKKAIIDLLEKHPDDLIVVTGSIAFIGLVRDWLTDK